MRRKPSEFGFEEESPKFEIGQEVPITLRYCLGQRATIVSINGEYAVIQFPNGARLENVPLRDLVDDRGYWKR